MMILLPAMPGTRSIRIDGMMFRVADRQHDPADANGHRQRAQMKTRGYVMAGRNNTEISTSVQLRHESQRLRKSNEHTHLAASGRASQHR
jgi:hypothetical protein